MGKLAMAASAAEVKVNRYHPARLVDGDGNFNANVEQDLNLADEKCPVAAVSIIGVQSSGKSTLLNKCFSTDFQEMDESGGIQTTKGIWIAKCPSPNGGLKILVIDTEGSDGSERGREGDDTFEKKTTLFALAMSNTLIFNMKCDSVNHHHGASRPLLETVLQIMLRKFSTPRRVNLVFVLRDKNMCPLDSLRSQLIRGLEEIWQGLSSTQPTVNAELKDYFNIEVMVMPHYRHEKQEFDKEVGCLRDQVMTLVQQGQLSIASSFAALAEKNWNDIKEDKILNLQLNKITVDGVFCREIADNKCKNFRRRDKSWDQIKRDVRSGNIIESFGNKVSAIIGSYLSEYDEETLDTEESKRIERRKELIECMLEDVEIIHLTSVENMRIAKLEAFKEALVQQIKGGSSELVSMNHEKVITEFTDFLKDANVEQANWNHPSEQLEKLKSELVSYEEGARTIALIMLKQLKIKNMCLWAGVAALGVSLVSTVVAGPFLLPAVAETAVARQKFGTIIFSAVTTVSAAIASAINSNRREQEINDTLLGNPAVGAPRKPAETAAARQSFAATISTAATSLSTIIKEATNSKQIEQELNDAILRNPAVGALWQRLARP